MQKSSAVQDILNYVKENGKLPPLTYEISLSQKSLLQLGATIVVSFGLLMVIYAIIKSISEKK